MCIRDRSHISNIKVSVLINIDIIFNQPLPRHVFLFDLQFLHQNISNIKVNSQVFRLSSATDVRSCPAYKPLYATVAYGVWKMYWIYVANWIDKMTSDDHHCHCIQGQWWSFYRQKALVFGVSGCCIKVTQNDKFLMCLSFLHCFWQEGIKALFLWI